MLFIQLLILCLVAYLGWSVLKLGIRVYSIYKTAKGIMDNIKSSTGTQQTKTTGQKSSAKMVKCSKCQLYIPEDEAYFHKEQAYCCKEHAEQ